MVTELLVDPRIEDGQQLVAELAQAGFDVSVAIWVKTSEEGRWYFYIGSTSVEPAQHGDAYLALFGCLSKIPNTGMDFSEIRLLQASDPIAKDAIAARDRHAGRSIVRFRGDRLGNMLVDEAYIYPRIGGQMTPREMLHALLSLATRSATAPGQPAVITLRDGSQLRAIITGFALQMPGVLTISTLDPATMQKEQVSGDVVANIQV